ncbi:hypothetical protein SAMN05216420_101357 [Nitrosospira sp. Nl5]|uniref:hypothetical protein n=1 Tax=Nitrosospira sp. Nl5 TaxID=200120 RepID=UPI000891CF5D|nr:hypothetical protein [Nitrosospira sp. Nl5]SCX92733.1 hypothetical protein SAMN05216420_101357 [Nitrosospira sp. Nl5]
MSNFDSTLAARIDIKAALARAEIRKMAQEATIAIYAMTEHHNRSAGQSRRFWNERSKRGNYG